MISGRTEEVIRMSADSYIVVEHVIDGGPSLERIQQAIERQDAGGTDPLPFQTNRDMKLFMATLTNEELRMSPDGALQLKGRLIDGGATFDGHYNPLSHCGRFKVKIPTKTTVAA